MAGDLVYFVIPVADADKGKAFYGGLLGWKFSEGNVPGGFNIEGSTPPGGMFGGGQGSHPMVYFDVDDIDAAIERVRELGGSAGEKQQGGAGVYVECRDDQGVEFSLFAPR